MLWPVLLPADIINCVAATRIDQPSENYSQTVVIRDPGRYEKGGTRDPQWKVRRNGKDRGINIYFRGGDFRWWRIRWRWMDPYSNQQTTPNSHVPISVIHPRATTTITVDLVMYSREADLERLLFVSFLFCRGSMLVVFRCVSPCIQSTRPYCGLAKKYKRV